MNCKLPIRSEIYNCTFIKTNKVAIIIPFVFKKKIQYRLNSSTICKNKVLVKRLYQHQYQQLFYVLKFQIVSIFFLNDQTLTSVLCPMAGVVTSV